MTLNFEHRNYYDFFIFFRSFTYRLSWTLRWLTGYKAPSQHKLLKVRDHCYLTIDEA